MDGWTLEWKYTFVILVYLASLNTTTKKNSSWVNRPVRRRCNNIAQRPQKGLSELSCLERGDKIDLNFWCLCICDVDGLILLVRGPQNCLKWIGWVIVPTLDSI